MVSQHHLLSEFDTLLNRLEDTVLRMGGLGKDAIARAAEGLFQRDVDACNAVIAADEEIDQLEAEVGRLALEIVTRFTPVATDLRTALSALRIAASLERVGDECVSIARKAKHLLASPEHRETKLLESLHDLAQHEFADALAALATRNAEAATDIARRDRELDLLCASITDKLTTAVHRPDGLPGADFAHLAMIAQCLERIGDQAKNLASETLFRIDPNIVHHTH